MSTAAFIENVRDGETIRLPVAIPGRGSLRQVAAGRPMTFRRAEPLLCSVVVNVEVATRKGLQCRTIALPQGTVVEVEEVVPA